MSRPSVEYAKAMARKLKKAGYLNAQIAEDYCIDGNEVGFDNFVTFTATVYVGKHKCDEKS